MSTGSLSLESRFLILHQHGLKIDAIAQCLGLDSRGRPVKEMDFDRLFDYIQKVTGSGDEHEIGVLGAIAISTVATLKSFKELAEARQEE